MKMKAIAVKEAGEPESLKVVELPLPEPTDHQVVVAQSFAGVNYGDAIRRKRGLFTLNEHGYFVPGFEGIGDVISVGSSVTGFAVGDRVAYLSETGGGYGQQVSIDEKFVFHVPEDLPDEIAAVTACVGVTAWELFKLSGLEKGSWALVHGATGGVGLLLVQICVLRGVNVIALVGTKEKKAFLDSRHAAVEAIVRDDSDLAPHIRALSGGAGVHATFDCVGQAALDTNLGCIRKGGVIVYYGSTSGHSDFPGMPILMNSLRVQGFNVFNFLQDTEAWRAAVQDVMRVIADKKLEIVIDRILPMERASEAHELMEARQSIGKLVLDLR